MILVNVIFSIVIFLIIMLAISKIEEMRSRRQNVSYSLEHTKPFTENWKFILSDLSSFDHRLKDYKGALLVYIFVLILLLFLGESWKSVGFVAVAIGTLLIAWLLEYRAWRRIMLPVKLQLDGMVCDPDPVEEERA